MDIATYRLNQPRGQFSKNSAFVFNRTIQVKKKVYWTKNNIKAAKET